MSEEDEDLLLLDEEDGDIELLLDEEEEQSITERMAEARRKFRRTDQGDAPSSQSATTPVLKKLVPLAQGGQKTPVPVKSILPPPDQVIMEKCSGLNVKTWRVSPSLVEEVVITGYPYANLANATRSEQAITVGVIVEKTLSRTTSNNQSKYMIWKVSDLDKITMSLFLFGESYETHWKESEGSVVAIIGATSSKEGSLTVNQSTQLVVLGYSVDCGVCKATRKDGTPCKAFINTTTTQYCQYHLMSGYRAVRAKESAAIKKPKSLMSKIAAATHHTVGYNPVAAMRASALAQQNKQLTPSITTTATTTQYNPSGFTYKSPVQPPHISTPSKQVYKFKSANARALEDLLRSPTSSSAPPATTKITKPRTPTTLSHALATVSRTSMMSTRSLKSTTHAATSHPSATTNAATPNGATSNAATSNAATPTAATPTAATPTAATPTATTPTAATPTATTPTPATPTPATTPSVSKTTTTNNNNTKNSKSVTGDIMPQLCRGLDPDDTVELIISSPTKPKSVVVPPQAPPLQEGNISLSLSAEDILAPPTTPTKPKPQIQIASVPVTLKSSTSKSKGGDTTSHSTSMVSPPRVTTAKTNTANAASKQQSSAVPTSPKKPTFKPFIPTQSPCKPQQQAAAPTTAPPPTSTSPLPPPTSSIYASGLSFVVPKQQTAMERAISIIQSKGGILPTDEQTRNITTASVQQSSSRSGKEKGAPELTFKEKLAAAFGTVDLQSEEGKQLLAKESSHSDLSGTAEAAKEFRFEMLEQREQILDNMQKIKEVTAKRVVHCPICNYTAEGRSQFCITLRHEVKTYTEVKKRFFKCSRCRRRTAALGTLLPTKPCAGCCSKEFTQISLAEYNGLTRNDKFSAPSNDVFKPVLSVERDGREHVERPDATDWKWNEEVAE